MRLSVAGLVIAAVVASCGGPAPLAVAPGGVSSPGASTASAASPDSQPSQPAPASAGPSEIPAPIRSAVALPPASASLTPSFAPSASPSLAPVGPAHLVLKPSTLQGRLDRTRIRNGIPGVAITIRFVDGRTWTGTSGYADVAGGVPITADTAFAFASASKMFTAAVVMELVQEGKLGLDDPVLKWLPGRKIDRLITIRMLLDHTSGLADYFRNAKIDKPLQSAKGRTWTADMALRYLGPRAAPPGRAWYYSNTNYLYLGLVVEVVTGHPLADEIRTRILDPLGLDETWYQAVETPRTTIAHAYRLVGRGTRAKPIDLTGKSDIAPFRSVITAADGAGSLAGTSADAARWIEALGTGRVVTIPTLELMMADSAATGALHARIPYGLGIQLVPIHGHAAIGHTGRYLGTRSLLRYVPDLGLSIAVLTNQSQVDPTVIAETLLSLVIPPPVNPCVACPAAH